MVFFWLLWKPLAIDKRAVSENLLSISKGELDASGNSCIVCKKGDVIPPFPPPPPKKKKEKIKGPKKPYEVLYENQLMSRNEISLYRIMILDPIKQIIKSERRLGRQFFK